MNQKQKHVKRQFIGHIKMRELKHILFISILALIIVAFSYTMIQCRQMKSKDNSQSNYVNAIKHCALYPKIDERNSCRVQVTKHFERY